MRIFSFNTTHDSSVCSLVDGELEFFSKEERLTRRKRDDFPIESLYTYASLNLGNIDHCLYLTPSNDDLSFFQFQEILKKKTLNIFSKNLKNFSSLTHHQCHAMLAYVNSKFDKSLVFVIDRNGSAYFFNNVNVARESESVYYFDKDTSSKIILKNFWCEPKFFNDKKFIERSLKDYYSCNEIFVKSSFSVVKVYESATTLIGQPQLENGKTMGLSSYGTYNEKKLFNDCGYPIDDALSHLNILSGDSKVCLSNCEHLITNNINLENYQFYADIAKIVQNETQIAVLKLIEKCVDETGVKNVCIVGGYGLNVVANNYYISKRKDINFYFEPISDDTGVPIGAAFLKYKMLTNKNPKPLEDTFFHYYNFNEKIGIGKFVDINSLVNILQQGKSIGIFNGPPEAGPRALGHRSILFDPRVLDGKNIVNKIKKREWYRPFAAVILEEEFNNWFHTEGQQKSKNMTINFFIKNKFRNLVPSVIHVDGSCRIQTVDKNDGFLYNLLFLFFKKTGCPILLNTSLNLAGEPLVQTKKDSLEVLKNSSLDYLYFVDEQLLVCEEDFCL